jgi:hypothetical protein
MNWRLWLIAAVLGVGLSGCAKESDVQKWADNMDQWLLSLQKSVCQIEAHTPGLPDNTTRACPGNGEGTAPPKYPPP